MLINYDFRTQVVAIGLNHSFSPLFSKLIQFGHTILQQLALRSRQLFLFEQDILILLFDFLGMEDITYLLTYFR